MPFAEATWSKEIELHKHLVMPLLGGYDVKLASPQLLAQSKQQELPITCSSSTFISKISVLNRQVQLIATHVATHTHKKKKKKQGTPHVPVPFLLNLSFSKAWVGIEGIAAGLSVYPHVLRIQDSREDFPLHLESWILDPKRIHLNTF